MNQKQRFSLLYIYSIFPFIAKPYKNGLAYTFTHIHLRREHKYINKQYYIAKDLFENEQH